jgi:DNA-directed RNA polymerase subunit RPC12/RpoP
VIRFKCIYCGQKILAPDDGADKKGKCPKCNHLLVVPLTTKGRPAISPNKEPMPEHPKPYVPEWDEDTHQMTPKQADVLIELCKEDFGFLIPTYDKLSLFLTAMTMLLLLLTNHHWIHPAKEKDWIDSFVSRNIDYRIILCFAPIIFISVVGFLWQVATSPKTALLLFAVLTNAAVGFISGRYVIKNGDAHNWQLIFPVWNIINSALLIVMLRFKIINEECISDRKATSVQIILGMVAVFVIFALCNYVFKLYWAITFSICIIYTTSFDRALQNILPGFYNVNYTSKEQVDT